MAFKVVVFILSPARNARQEVSAYQRRESSGRAERGSNRLQAQLAAAATGCKLSLLSFGEVMEGRLQMGMGVVE